MMCLTLTQPFASLMAIGAKRFETRSWRTQRRGLLAIHAAKGWTATELSLLDESPFANALEKAGLSADSVDDLRGHVLAVVELVDCVAIREHRRLPPETHGIASAMFELDFGGYAPGRWAWVTRDLVRLVPFRASGKQGLWELDDALVTAAYPREAARG